MAHQEEIPQVRLLTPDEFVKRVRTAHLHRTTKLIAMHMSSYADYRSGKQIFPGERYVAEALGLKERCVREHLKICRQLNILTRVRHNSGKWRIHDEYWLSWPLDEESILDKLRAKPDQLTPVRMSQYRPPKEKPPEGNQ